MPDELQLPDARPDRFELDTLLALRRNPPRLGQWVMARRRELFGSQALIWASEASEPDPGASAAFPTPERWSESPEARVQLCVEPEDGPRAHAYLEWLLELAHLAERGRPVPRSVAPYSTHAAGTHRLWLIAVARLVLPASIRVEARHDLVGIRLAQIALGFGADVLSGPIESDRHLPVAGVTRPNEATLAGLRNLIEQAGLEAAA